MTAVAAAPLDPLVHMTLALAFAALLGASAWHKVRDWNEWAGLVANYQVLPQALAAAAARILPTLEAGCAIGLLLPPTRLIAAATTALLLAVYGLAIALNLMRGRDRIDCGCLGSRAGGGIAPWMVLRNGVLALLAALLLSPVGARPQSAAEWPMAIALVLTLGFLYPVLTVVLMREPRPAGVRRS